MLSAYIFLTLNVINMEEPYYSSTLRIKNPKTLKKWIKDGRYQQELDEGYQFNLGCGRFTVEKCECHFCRKRTRPHLHKIVDEYEKRDALFEIWAFADWKDKSTEWLLSMMSDKITGWDDSDAADWISNNSSKRAEWYKKFPNWYKKYE